MSIKKSKELVFKNIIYNQCLLHRRCGFVVDEDEKICGWCRSIEKAFSNQYLGDIPILESFDIFKKYFNFDVASKMVLR